jgi:hypothetical protein
MLKIEDHLRAMPHTRIQSSDQRYQKLFAKYQQFKQRYPDRSPTYYNSRLTWML